MKAIIIRPVVLALLLGCTSCDWLSREADPYTRQGMWQPSGVVDRNLAVMVANRNDLVVGRGVTTPDSRPATDAVNRLWAGRPKPLPVSVTQDAVTPQTGGGGGGGNSGGSGGSGGGSP
jgi:hypothetical protein